jgi:hypothetical protein
VILQPHVATKSGIFFVRVLDVVLSVAVGTVAFHQHLDSTAESDVLV